jgi:hypothetical protein
VKTILFAASLALTFAGCAAMRASKATGSSYCPSGADSHLRTILWRCMGLGTHHAFCADYQVKSADAAAGLTLETEWKGQDGGAAVRYLFQGRRLRPPAAKWLRRGL